MGFFNNTLKNNMDDYEAKNRKRILDILARIPGVNCPEGWKRTDIAIGGLLYVGFSEVTTNKLVCISSQAQSVIDCDSLQINYCTEDYDEDNLAARADELENEIIHIAGIGGGGMRLLSKTGESLIQVSPQYPKENIVYQPHYLSCFTEPEKCMYIYSGYEIRAYGFSQCNNYFVIGDSATLSIFKRL